MVKMGDGRSPYESSGARKKKFKTPFRPDAVCLSLNLFKQFISTTTPVSPMAKMGDGRAPYRTEKRSVRDLSGQALEEQIASCAEPVKAYKRSTIGISHALRQGSKLINDNATRLLKSPIMASPQHPATMENLPHELLSNIFIRLLAKQLAQMRSVSKSWNALLSESSFVKSHLHHSIHNNDQILLIFHDKYASSFDQPLTAQPTRSPYLELATFIKLPVNPQSGHTHGIRVIGSVNGLICSSYHTDSVVHIWNPSLSTVLTLPPYSTPSDPYINIKTYFRFGFDPKTDDYKVVKLTGLNGPYEDVVTWWLQVEIYSMRKGSWELITGRFPSHITYIFDEDYVCVDGHDGNLHWLGCTNEEEDPKTLVAFDLGSETFREIPLPDSTLNHNQADVHLGVLARKLCVMSWVDGTFEVWVMEEYGVDESWVKRLVFSQLNVGACVFGFTSHSEFLIEDNNYLVFYDPSANKQKIWDDDDENDVEKIVEYVDSLVWVAPAEQKMVDG